MFSPLSRRLVVSLVIACSIVAAVLFGAVTRADFDPANVAAFLPTITATKSDTSLSGDGDGKADPGETIGYTVVIGNTGPDPATGVNFSDTIDANTTLSGSASASTLAVDDTFPVTVTGNVSINTANMASPFSVVTNDFLGVNVSPAVTVSAFDATSSQGGQVTMVTSGAGIGRFTYDPPAGFEGTDTFTYTLSDNTNASSSAANRTGTVSITVSGMVWFINNNATSCTVAGCGRLSNPFSTLAAFDALNDGVGNHPAANDSIFVYESGTAYTGGVGLLNGQKFIGQDATQSLSTLTGITPVTGSTAFPAMNAGGSTTLIQNAAGDGVTLATGNALHGFTGGNASAAAIAGTNFGNLTVADVVVNTTGMALNLNTGTASSVTFTSVTSTGGTNNVSLNGLAGTFNLSGGIMSGATGSSFTANGGAGTINFGGSITSGTGRSVNITNKTGGAVNFSGAVTDNDLGINLATNPGASINFTGGVVASTGSNTAFSATGGGTVAVTGTTNTLTTTTATALGVSSTNIGLAGLTFLSISSNGATTGISLNSTGTTAGTHGGLTVTGTGTTDGSGGTIQNTTSRGVSITNGRLMSLSNMNFTNAATIDSGSNCSNLSLGGNSNLGCSAPVHLDTVTNATLNNLNIAGSSQQGINGRDVTNFVLADTVITGIGNAADEDGIHFLNMSGTSSITNTSVTGSFDDNLIVQNLSGTGTLTISGSTFSNSIQGSGILFGIRGTANSTINIQGSTQSNNNFSGGIVADAFETSAMDLNVTNITSSGNNDQLSVSAGDTSSVDLIATGNTLSSVGAGDFVVVSLLGSAFDTGYTLDANISNNTITVGNNLTADGINAGNRGAGTMNLLINSNTFNYSGTQNPINIAAGQDGVGAVSNVTITGNNLSLQQEGIVATDPLAAVIVASAVASPSGDGAVTCADIGGAGAASNTVTRSLGIIPSQGDIRTRHRFGGASGTIRLPGYVGAAGDTAAVIAYLVGRNTLVAPETATATSDVTGLQYTGGGACTQPSFRPIEADETAMIDAGYQRTIETLGQRIAQIQLATGSYSEDKVVTANGEGIVDGESNVSQGTAPFNTIVTIANRLFSLVVPTVSAQNRSGEKPLAVDSGETVSIGPITTLPSGKSVTITFNVTVDALGLGEIRTRILNQGTVSGSNFASVLTGDPAASGDPACTAPPALGGATCTPVDRPDTSVVSLTRQSTNPTTNPSVTWQIVFADPVNGLTENNFTLVTTGTVAGAVISAPTETSGPPSTTWNISASGITGDGTLELRMANSTGLSHDVTNLPYTEPANGAVYTIDNTPPSTTSFTRFNPATSPTNADTLVFRATFSENVISVDAADFAATGTTATVTGVAGVGGGPDFSAYDITVSGGDLAGLNGTVGLNFSGAMSITDAASNPLPNTEPATDQTYLLDNLAPTVNIVDVSPDPRNTAVASIAINFSENVTGFDIGDLTLTRDGGASLLPGGASVTGGPSNYSLTTLTPLTTPDGSYVLTLTAPGGITDAAGNALVVADTDSWVMDTAKPDVTINQAGGQADPTFVNPINFTVVFNEPVTDFDDAADVTVSGTAAGVGSATVVITPNSSTNYTVAISGITGDGTVIATIPAGIAVDGATNTNNASTSTDNTVTFVTCAPPPANMKGWWSGDTTLRDIAGGNDGTFVGTTAYTTGKVGQAFDFNGSSSVSVGSPTPLKLTNSVTVDAWVRPTALPAPGSLMGVATKWVQNFSVGDNTDSFALWLQNNGGTLQVFSGVHLASGAEPILVGGAVPLNTWSHVAMTYDHTTGTFTIYVNGVSVGTVANPAQGIIGKDSPIAIGREQSGQTRFFTGQIDEVEIFDRALTVAEIQSIVNADGSGKCKPSDLRVDKAHAGSFTQGSAGSYTVTVSNDGPVATSGTTTMTDTLPVGLTPGTPTAPSGWTCPAPVGQAVSCTSTDVVASGGSFPVITIPVTVTQNSPLSVTNTATVSGGGEMDTSDDSDPDPTTIIGVAQTPSVTNAATVHGAQTTSGLVITPNPGDGAEVTYYKITNILNGTLFQNDGATPIAAGSFITAAQGGAGLKFTPALGFVGNATFDIQASVSNADGGLGGSVITATIIVSQANTLTTITSDNPDPSVFGGNVVVNFSVMPVAPGAGVPAGNVVVTVSGGAETCTGTAASGTCTIALTAIGARTLTATYAGDAFFIGSSDTEAHQVDQAATSTTITSDNPDPSVTGQPVVVSFTVTPNSPGAGVPTGNVVVTVSGGPETCTGTVAAGTCTVTLTSAGSRTLTATYAGDVNFIGSSVTETHQVDKAATTSTITSDNPDPSVTGEPVIVNFTVTSNAPGAGTPTGNVIVTVSGGAETCTGTVAAGTCTITLNSAGARTLTAAYAGDSNFLNSSDAEPHQVNQAATSFTSVNDTPDPTNIDQPYTVSWTLGVTAPGTGTPGGTVTVSDGTGDSCSATLPASNCTMNSLTQGTKTLTYTYSGDANFLGTTNNATTHVVNCTPNPVVTNANNSGPGSLRKAVADTCSTGGQNTITFAPGPLPNGELTPEAPDAPSVTSPISLTSQIVIASNMVIQGPGANLLTVQNTAAPSATSRVFQVNSGVTATISGLTISGGNVSGDGGGIYNLGTLTLAQSRVVGNTVTGIGGGVYNRGGTLSITDSTISGNTASLGGALENIRFGGDPATALTITRSTLAGNFAGSGAGIHNQGATLTMNNSTVSGNIASASDPTGGGGALENVAGGFNTNATLTGCTFFGNQHTASSDPTADEIYSGNFGFQSTVTLRNTIVGGSPATATPNMRVFTDGTILALGIITSQGYNISADNGGGFLTGTADQTNTDPLLAPLTNNGGPTQTHAFCTSAGVPHPSCGGLSPAIDKGKDFFGSGFDQRGNGVNQVRPFDIAPIANAAGGDGSDVGAYELNNTPPTITAAATTRLAGSPTANSQVATAGDLESPVNTLTLAVNGGNTATVNGVTVTLTDSNEAAAGINPTAAGAVFADVVAACGATTATFTLTVTDGGGLSTNAILTVTVTANTPPVLTYNDPAAVVFGQNGINISPATGPSDNGSVTSIQLQSAGTFTGNVSVNPNGTIAIGNAGPAGTHTISIRATDNCGAQTTATFQITVNKANTNTGVQVLVNAPTYGSQLTATATITAIPPGSGTPQGTVNFFDGANPITACQNVPVNALGAATCSTNTLPAGVNKSISAQYSGNANFNPSTGAATQTIDKVQLNVTASSHTVTYGDAAPSVTSTITGFVLGETTANLGTQPSCSTTYTQGSPVSGSQYPTSCSGGVSGNYSFNYINGTVTVNKRALTVTADNKSRGYGAANPALTASFSGFIGSDNAANSTTGTAGLSTTATATSPVGSYPITATVGTLASGNYSFTTFTNGTLSVTAVQLTVTANNQTRVYGAPNPTLTYSITGFVNGEGVGALTGTPTITTSATATSAPGTYPITAAVGTLANPNYTFTTANGTLTVTQASTTTTITNAAALGNPTSAGQSYAVNWTTSPVAPATGTPTGNVTVSDGTQTCTAAVAAGTCSLTSTTSGTKTITATYAGDTNFAGSTSQPVQHNVIVGLTGNVKQFVAFGTNTNLAGVTITLTNTTTSQSTTTTTDANGNYSFINVTLGQNFSITPSGLGKVYEATSRTYNNAVGNIAGADFLAYDIVGPNTIPRSARVQSQIATQGQPVTVPILFTATGVETKVSFSVEYPANALGIPTATCGTGTVNCTVTIDNSLAGKAGITITPAAPLTAGTREIVKITFPTFTSPATSAAIRFGDFPQAKDVRNAENNALPTLYWTDGLISFTGGTLLDGASISGKVTTAAGQGLRNATVTLLDTAGGKRTTVTSSFGNYTFENLDTGRDYMLIVTSKRYRFASRLVNLTGNLNDVNLVGLE